MNSIVVNDSVLINKKQTGHEAQRLTTSSMTGDQSAPILIFGGALEGGKGKSIYIEYSNVIFKGECSAYEGDWYFAYGSNVVFAYATQTNNPIGVGNLVFRRSSWTLSTLSDKIEDRNIYAQISNNIILDGGTGTDYSLRIFESEQDHVLNTTTNTFNRSYKILSGNIADGKRGAAMFTWGDRTDMKDDMAKYQNMSLIFTGDNSEFGVFNGYSDFTVAKNNKNSAGYSISKNYASWALGKTPYNMEKLGGINAIPFIFGDGSAFSPETNSEGKYLTDENGNYVYNFAKIAGYGAFVTGEYGAIDSLTGTDYSSVGFQYKSDVTVGNAFFGNIRLVNLDSGTITLTNTANQLNAGIWVTGGGAIAFDDIKELGNGSINLLAGTLIFTGTGEATFSRTLANKSSVFEYVDEKTGETKYYCDTQSGAWGIEVKEETATLHWNAEGSYGSNYDTLERNVRENDFTKTGKGTLEITDGNLITPSTSGREYIGGTKKYYADVYLKAGTLKLSGDATLGATQTLYMQGGSLVSQQNLSFGKTEITWSSATDGNGLTSYYDYSGNLFTTTATVTGTEYQDALAAAGFVGSLDLKLTFSASGQENKQAFTYDGNVLYYHDSSKGWMVVGREYSNGDYRNTTELAKLAEQLANSYTDNEGKTQSALYGTIIAENISKLVFNYDGQLVTGLTQLRNGKLGIDYTQDVKFTTILVNSSCTSSTESITLTIPLGQTLTGTLVLDANGIATNLANDTLFDSSTLNDLFPGGTYTSSIYLSAVKGETSHNISINDGAGTLTLAGGKMTIEFTYFGKNEDGTNYETEGFNGVTRPSYTYLNLDGKFEVTAESELELTFSNKAVLSRGVYLLVDAGETISEESIAKLKLTGIVADNDLATRQTISLLRGDEQKVIDVLTGTVKSSNVDTTARSSTGTTFKGDDSQLYLYITPGSAILYWNTTNNAWAQHEDEQYLQDNWKFQDGYSLTDYEGKTDTNFYANDMVYFSDVERTFKEGEVDADGNQRQDIKKGSTHTVYIEGKVHPLQMVVDAEQDNYIFKSVTDTEKGKDKKAGCIDGAVTLVKEGAGTLTIYTKNSYTGGTEITKGTVNALAEQALGTGTVIVTEDGVLNVGAATVEIEYDKHGKIVVENGVEKITYFNEAGTQMDKAVENVLYGALKLDIRGVVNIYAASDMHVDSSVAIGAELGGGILNAYAANALGSVAVTVAGGELHAFVDNVFSGNAVTVRGSDETNAGIKAKVFAESEGSLNNATFDVWGDGVIYAKAESIGNAKNESNGDVGTIINLYGNTRADYRPGMIVIAADKALDGIEKVSFNMGGVIKVEQGNYDISNFTNWEWQSATGAEIKVGDATAITEALAGTINPETGLAFAADELTSDAAKTAAAAASSLRISSTNMVAASTKIIHKTGTGTLYVDMDFQADNPTLTKFMGDFYFDDDTNLDGKVVFDFGTKATAENRLTYAGTLKGKGAVVEFTGTCGEVNETYAHWFENMRIVNMTDVKDASGNKISKGTLYANETLIYMSTEEIKALNYSTRFDSGDLVLQALPTDNGAYRIGNIVTSTADSRYDVEIKSVNAHGYIVASQNICDGTFDGKFVNNTVAVTTTNSDGTTTTTNETYNISIDKYGTHTLTLANDNTSSGTLHIYEGAVRIGDGKTTLGDWGGDIIAEAGTTLYFNFTNEKDADGNYQVVDIFGGSDDMRFSGDGKIVFESGYIRLYNSSAFEDMAGTKGQIVIESNATVVFDYSLDVAAGTTATLNGDANVMIIAGGVNLYDTEQITTKGEEFTGTLILAGISDENVVRADSDGENVTINSKEYSAFIDNSFDTSLKNDEDKKLTTIVNPDSDTKTDIGELLPDLVNSDNSSGNENGGNGESSEPSAQIASAEVQTLSVAANLVSLSTVSVTMISDTSATVNEILAAAETEDAGTGDSTGTETSDVSVALDLSNTSNATLIIDLGNVNVDTLRDNAHGGISAISIASSTASDDDIFSDVVLNDDGTLSLTGDIAFSGEVKLQNADDKVSSYVYNATTGVLYVTAKPIPEPSLFGFLSGVFALLLASTRRRRSRR